MTTEKYVNIYRLMKHPKDHLRGMLRDLDDPGLGVNREEIRMKRQALESLIREKNK